MRRLLLFLLLAASAAAQQLPHDDAVRIAEFYRLAPRIQDQLWPEWSKVPAPLLLVTPNAEFLTHHLAPPKEFTKVADDLFARPRQFPTNLLATFPAFGPPSVIVIGEPQNTQAKTSTPWLTVLMHEHFHQLQYAQPEYYDAVQKLGLSHGDQTGMWMLNYAFPYENGEVAQAFARLRDLLLEALSAPDGEKFRTLAATYVKQRQHAIAQLSPDDHKYLGFQLWQEGIARYVQIKAAEAAAAYQPSTAYTQLPDYEPFAEYAPKAKTNTLDELRHADLVKMKRVFFYSFGACEGLLLDRLNPHWKKGYFQHLLTTDPLFEGR